MSTLLQNVHDRLLERYGPQHWWPGATPLEIMIGAVLVQNTTWKNAAKAIENLREAGLLDLERLQTTSTLELSRLLVPAGYYRQKTRRLRGLIEFIADQYGGSLTAMFETPLATLREQLLTINGIGPETADAILLYAGGLPAFVVDTFAARVLKRHGWIEPEADYYAIQQWFESQLERDAALFNEYHALLVRVGNEHCGKQPLCRGCPLEELLPCGGALEL